jgi:hypothetical protein
MDGSTPAGHVEGWPHLKTKLAFSARLPAGAAPEESVSAAARARTEASATSRVLNSTSVYGLSRYVPSFNPNRTPPSETSE